MTTLYDAPVQHKYESDSGSDYDENDESLEMAEYDLDVVDDALLNPNSNEYMDHFGFRIHVRTDDEASSDDESDFDQVKKKLPSTTSDDDSIETHITTPNLSDEKYQAHRPLNTSVPILKNPPPRQRSATQTSEDIRTSKETHRSSTSQNSRYSILSSFNNPFKVPPRPASIVSVQSVVKPSETYQQRQSKRYSESLPSLIGIPRSPASNHRHFDKLVSKFRRFSHHDHQYDSEKHLMLKEEAMEELKIYKEKGGIQNNSIDWDFWSMVIDDFGKLIETQMDDMRQHLAKGGMPSPIRGLLWQIIAKSRDSFDMESEYKEILKRSTSPFEKQIQRDLTRTFPNHPYFMQESGRQALFNVAKAYSIFDQEVGYCQGLAFIIGCLLLHMSEENAFCVLIKLMGKYGLRGHFTPRMEVLHQQLYQFDHVCQQKLPVIHRHMENEGVTPSMYASQWFITLFAYRCPIEMVFRVIDLLLVEGTQVLIQIGLALLVRNQEKILKLHFETLIDFLCNGVFSVFGDDGDRFVQDTYRVDLPVRFMARLAQQFTGEEARESKSVSQEDNLRRMNGQLSEHLRSVEAQLQLIRTENQELTQRIITTKMDHARTEDEKDQLKHDMARMKANFEKALADLKTENERLAANNIGLADQLADTESQLISLKIINRFAAAAAAQSTHAGRTVFIDGQHASLDEYPFRLNFYLKPPPAEITIEEFEGFALDRLQLYEERRKDHISHFVLRMAYCKSEDLREWFIKQETALFQFRFEQETMEEKKHFLEYLNLSWKILSLEEKESMREALETCSRPKQGMSVSDYVSLETFFEVDFEKVPHMVGNRSVYLNKGKAYVPMTEQINLVMLEFKNYLQKALEATAKLLPRLEEDDRLKPILLNVEKQYVGKLYSVDHSQLGSLSAKEVDAAVHHHAPLCMRNLHDALRADKHLRHGGRLQYGLFLKGIGLSVEEALLFWRTAFSSMTDDKFNKEHAYNIRFNYGLEGKRTNYTPHSCMKIISGNPPSTGDNHGCPFRHFSAVNLENRLRRDKISQPQIDEIMELVRQRHYQVACTRHFEVTHPNTKQVETIEHPNQYYEMSKASEESHGLADMEMDE
ncbi:eukaryotic and archaeal DNA primase, large subunit-domain-containing protein [Gilbertella persicaria]|uniref:eukaryotic and archaeal DNA primase, large subunit-domain-containing protein n=1 Tax=Gilbertella persicaria TaxID=101096 RepID=UPI00221EAA12|nr:eukaryotic and archaeal DNA primase, large subunit-domain-containing protein [Gilbertella persicaria]KAI8069021.1 eukaryotic and archaeal DNA primase, large subunit-domain-containing protein [Gilbertella persicaria]